ncbi:MarR family winged helix-turn-helix transcriptional regulator [Arthrobacter sp.]|uniref:MarR family winged helix-turn-helix transcriptional regulator n=1 Tax=Arthrobacter sp. TaxID=1667 RepID=UPI003A90212E
MDLAYELHDLVRTLDRHADAMLRPHGLTYNRFVTLVIAAEHPGLTGRQLARAVGISEPAMSAIVRHLLGAGLVDDGAGDGAGNVRRIRVTLAGAQRLGEARGTLGDSLTETARRLDIDTGELAATIHRLHQALRDSPTPREDTP